MTHGTLDPAQQWSSLLTGLDARQHAAVVAALRSSVEQGWPADAEGVRLLVAYAKGEIDAQEYAVGILVSMGVHGADARPEPQPPAPRPYAQSVPTVVTDDLAGPMPPTRPAPAAPTAAAPAPAGEPRVSREEAVAAYVAGRISVEEFLRISRGVSA